MAEKVPSYDLVKKRFESTDTHFNEVEARVKAVEDKSEKIRFSGFEELNNQLAKIKEGDLVVINGSKKSNVSAKSGSRANAFGIVTSVSGASFQACVTGLLNKYTSSNSQFCPLWEVQYNSSRLWVVGYSFDNSRPNGGGRSEDYYEETRGDGVGGYFLSS